MMVSAGVKHSGVSLANWDSAGPAHRPAEVPTKPHQAHQNLTELVVNWALPACCVQFEVVGV